MKLSDAIDIVRRTAKNAAEDVYPDDAIIGAIASTCDDFLQRTRIIKANGFVNLSAADTAFSAASLTNSLSGGATPLTDFRAERLVQARLLYVNAGTWTTATAYTVNQMVVGDGTPDSYRYLCRTAHTSSGGNEPPNTTYWTRLVWAGGVQMEVVAHHNISEWLDRYQPRLDSEAPVASERPRYVAFRTQTTGNVWPVPDTAYSLELEYIPAFTSVKTGDAELAIPDEYLRSVLQWGVPAALQHTEPEMRYANSSWQKYEALVARSRGHGGFETRMSLPTEEAFL